MPMSSPLDPEFPSTLVATTGDRSTSTSIFILALAATTLVHIGLIMLVPFDLPVQRADIGPGPALEIRILPGAGPNAAYSPIPDRAPSQHDLPAATAVEDPLEPVLQQRSSDEPRPAVSALPEQAESEQENAPMPQPDPISVEEVVADPVRDRSLPELGPEPATGTGGETSLSPPAPSERLPLETLSELETEPAPDPALEPVFEPMSSPKQPIDAAQILASRGDAIERLAADARAETLAHAGRVRRKSVSAGTREFRYASYLGAWARKVERIGNLNYPQAARDQRMFGSLILHVAVRSDGSVEQIRVVRSSGYDLLDDAAVRIVQLASPYAPFPPDIAAETDVLDIVRTWQFLQGGRLGWEP
jgi:periplasmic protein TonB